MALILLSGHPTSGKTHRATQLHNDFLQRTQTPSNGSSTNASSQRNLQVQLISDHTLRLPRSSFATANTEKTARATLTSAVRRALGKNTVLIVDSGNYIKGLRYQLHCEAKALSIRSCVIHVGTPSQKCTEINEARLATDPDSVGGPDKQDAYDVQVHAELLMRFEEPNAASRWDSPLYTVLYDDDAPPCRRIWDEVVLGLTSNPRGETGQMERKPLVRPNAATMLPSATKEGALHELDRTTNAIVCQVNAYVKQHEEVQDVGGCVDIEIIDGEHAELNLPARKLGAPEMQRRRRQFMQLQRQQMGSQGAGAVGEHGGGIWAKEDIAQAFVRWLGDSFDTG